jgi:hypothetical protein
VIQAAQVGDRLQSNVMKSKEGVTLISSGLGFVILHRN